MPSLLNPHDHHSVHNNNNNNSDYKILFKVEYKHSALKDQGTLIYSKYLQYLINIDIQFILNTDNTFTIFTIP